MNVANNVPRYQASFPLQLAFLTNADGCGDQVFTQIKRTGTVCLYKRTRLNGTVHGYEVFTAKLVKAGSPLPGGAKVAADYESYPGKSSFGRTAWAVNDLDRAEERFDALLGKESAEVVDNEPVEVAPIVVPVVKVDRGAVIPEGEFNRVQFAEANGFPVDKQAKAYQFIQALIEEGRVKESRRVATGGRGRPSVLYVKA
jgi:hypothetical protein